MNQKGFSIIAIIATMLILAVLGVVLISLVTTGSNISVNQLQSEQALYVAEGGGEYAIKQLKDNPLYTGDINIPLGSGTFTTTITDLGGGQNKITSTSTVGSSTRVFEATMQGGEAINDGGFTDIANWPDGNCPSNKNEGAVTIVTNSLSIATATGKKKTMDDCRQQALATAIPPSTQITLSLKYGFSTNYACSNSSSNTTAKCIVSIVFVYADNSTETPWTNTTEATPYPSPFASVGPIARTTKAGVNLITVRIKYDIESANQNNAQTTGWVDDLSLLSSFAVINRAEVY